VIAGIGPEGPLAIYLTLGMVATVNPCGFAMLPAYLAYFLGVDDRQAAVPRATVATALRVAAAVAAGFLAVFALAGLAVELTSLPVYENVPWISIVIGAALFVLGVAMLWGFELVVRLPKLDRGGRERTVRSMFVFGVSYAIASIGCTLPLFLGAVSGTINRESVADGLVVFGVYALGMTLVLRRSRSRSPSPARRSSGSCVGSSPTSAGWLGGWSRWPVPTSSTGGGSSCATGRPRERCRRRASPTPSPVGRTTSPTGSSGPAR